MNICVDCIQDTAGRLYGQLAIAVCTHCGRTDVCVWRANIEKTLIKVIKVLDLRIDDACEDLST